MIGTAWIQLFIKSYQKPEGAAFLKHSPAHNSFSSGKLWLWVEQIKSNH